jgi:hypothetical protein
MSPARKTIAQSRSLYWGAACATCAAVGCLSMGFGCGGTSSADTSGIRDSSGGRSSSGGSSSSDSTTSSGSTTGGASSGTSTGGASGTSNGGGASSGGSTGASSSSGGGASSGSSSGGSSSGEVPDGGPLDPDVAPGGNFDLSLWELQLPIGSANSPTVIPPLQLKGPNGFQDTYFFTDPTDGSMTFWDPENGVTTGGSDYPRSELREMTEAGAYADWQSSGTNTLSATLKVTRVPDHVCVGQIHTSGSKPLLELYYYSNGGIVLGIEQTPAGGNEVPHTLGNVPLGMPWSYVIGLSGSSIALTLGGGPTQKFTMPSSFDGQGMYFKAGDYDQTSGSSATVGAQVQFYALTVLH